MPQRPKARANQIKSAPNKIAPPQPSPSIQKTPSRAAISQHPPVQMAASAKSSLADQVRREWKLFEEWLAELRQEANQAKSKALQELRQSLEVSKKSYPKGYHNALMNQFEVKKREILDEMGESPEFFHMVRTEWDERLERAGLKVEYWDPMTPEEQRVVQIALGGDTEEEEYYPSRGPPEMQNPALHLAVRHNRLFRPLGLITFTEHAFTYLRRNPRTSPICTIDSRSNTYTELITPSRHGRISTSSSTQPFRPHASSYSRKDWYAPSSHT